MGFWYRWSDCWSLPVWRAARLGCIPRRAGTLATSRPWLDRYLQVDRAGIRSTCDSDGGRDAVAV